MPAPPRPRPAPDGRRGWRKIAIVGGILLIVAVVDVILFTGGLRRGGGEPVGRPDLRAAAMMGCWVVRAGPWSLTFPARRVAPDSVPGGADDSISARRARLRAGRRDTLPSALEPPARVALLPDSADLHGRDLPSFRAVPIPEGERPGRVLRWTVRGDTLWLVWSEPDARGGAALFAEGDSLVGFARGVADSVDASAPAAAWPINCSTLGRERGAGAPRR